MDEDEKRPVYSSSWSLFAAGALAAAAAGGGLAEREREREALRDEGGDAARALLLLDDFLTSGLHYKTPNEYEYTQILVQEWYEYSMYRFEYSAMS